MNIKGSLGENQEFRVKPDPIKLMFPIPADFTHEYLTQSEEAVKTEEAPKQAEKLEEKPIEEVTPVAQEEPPVEEVSPEVQEPVMPNLEDKMKSQEQAEQEDAAEEAPVEQAVADEPEEVLEPIPYWLYAAIPIGVLLFGVGGFFVYRKIMNKKLASTQNDAPKESLDKPDVALNDGLDVSEYFKSYGGNHIIRPPLGPLSHTGKSDTL